MKTLIRILLIIQMLIAVFGLVGMFKPVVVAKSNAFYLNMVVNALENEKNESIEKEAPISKLKEINEWLPSYVQLNVSFIQIVSLLLLITSGLIFLNTIKIKK